MVDGEHADNLVGFHVQYYPSAQVLVLMGLDYISRYKQWSDESDTNWM